MPKIPAVFSRIKQETLGLKYDLSFALIKPAAMRRAMKYKKMSTGKVSNVLAFPLSKTSGEVLICKAAAKPFSSDYLLIHALLHLKGYKHGARMDSEECRILRTFGLNIHEHPYYRNRRRHTPR